MKPVCPECGSNGWLVDRITVGTHIDVKYWSVIPRRMGFCPNPSCQVVYFSENLTFRTCDVKTKVWHKRPGPPVPVCYCMKVTEDDLRLAVAEGASTVEEIVERTHAGMGRWCIVANPAGICCREYLGEALKPYLREKIPDGSFPISGIPRNAVVRLKIQGMSCPECGKVVRNALRKAGVGNVLRVDHKEGIAELRVENPKKLNKAARELQAIGFRVDKIEVV